MESNRDRTVIDVHRVKLAARFLKLIYEAGVYDEFRQDLIQAQEKHRQHRLSTTLGDGLRAQQIARDLEKLLGVDQDVAGMIAAEEVFGDAHVVALRLICKWGYDLQNASRKAQCE